MAAGADRSSEALETLLAHMVDFSEVGKDFSNAWSSAVVWKLDNVMMEYSALYFENECRQCIAATDTWASCFGRDEIAFLVERSGVWREKS